MPGKCLIHYRQHLHFEKGNEGSERCGHQAGITQVKRGRSGTEPSRPLQCTCCPPLGSAAPKGGPRAPSLEPRAPPSWSLQPHPGRGPSGAVGGGSEQGSPCPVTEARGLGRGPERAGLAGEAFAEVYVVSPEVLGTCEYPGMGTRAHGGGRRFAVEARGSEETGAGGSWKALRDPVGTREVRKEPGSGTVRRAHSSGHRGLRQPGLRRPHPGPGRPCYLPR